MYENINKETLQVKKMSTQKIAYLIIHTSKKFLQRNFWTDAIDLSNNQEPLVLIQNRFSKQILQEI